MITRHDRLVSYSHSRVTRHVTADEKMVDKSCDDATEERLCRIVAKQKGVLRIDSLIDPNK